MWQSPGIRNTNQQNNYLEMAGKHPTQLCSFRAGAWWQGRRVHTPDGSAGWPGPAGVEGVGRAGAKAGAGSPNRGMTLFSSPKSDAGLLVWPQRQTTQPLTGSGSHRFGYTKYLCWMSRPRALRRIRGLERNPQERSYWCPRTVAYLSVSHTAALLFTQQAPEQTQLIF